MYRVYHTEVIKIGPFTTSRIEIQDILKAWVAISIAFAIVLGGLTSNFLPLLIISAITVGLGFLLHELGHKIVAQRYGCFAEFRSFDNMLILAILMSFLGFIFAAPGAVMISGPVGTRRNGKISVAGPIVNYVLAILFLLLYLYVPYFRGISLYGFIINTWIGLFNMIPVWQFDGAKILRWNKIIYAAMVVMGFVLMLTQGIIPKYL